MRLRLLEFLDSQHMKVARLVALGRPILEYWASCWDPYREGHINALERVQEKETKFAYHMNYSVWDTLVKHR